MGVDNCNMNVWAVQLRKIVVEKFLSCNGVEALNFSEERRNLEIQNNIYTVEKMMKAIGKKDDKKNILNKALSDISNQIETLHIKRAKLIMLHALN
jgi:hypothetical protein